MIDPLVVEMVFDGGSLGNPGQGYGSYWLRVGGNTPRIQRLRFGPLVTSNQAEYLALIAGLEGAVEAVEARPEDPGTATLLVRGDSQLVLKQVAGRWKVRQQRLSPLRDRAVVLLKRFTSVELRWQPRAATVRLLGH